MAVKKQFQGSAEALGDRRVRVQCSSETIDRVGDIVIQAGIMHAASVPVLWQHNPDTPIGRAYPRMDNGVLVAEVEFAPAGVDAEADRICGLVKAGVINTVSIGFDAMKAEPMQASLPKGPQRYLETELLELSFVSVPAQPDAVVTNRAAQEKNMTIKAKPVGVAKGLYECGELARLLSNLSWIEESAEYEARREGDDSPLPAMLAAIMMAMGNALIAMTVEEVRELVGAEMDEAGEKAALPTVQKFRTAVTAELKSTREKAGRTLSAATRKALADIDAMHEECAAMLDAATKGYGNARAALTGMLKENADTETQSGGTVSTDGNSSATSADKAGPITGDRLRAVQAKARLMALVERHTA